MGICRTIVLLTLVLALVAASAGCGPERPVEPASRVSAGGVSVSATQT